jgi:hypothetical protein
MHRRCTQGGHSTVEADVYVGGGGVCVEEQRRRLSYHASTMVSACAGVASATRIATNGNEQPSTATNHPRQATISVGEATPSHYFGLQGLGSNHSSPIGLSVVINTKHQ